MATTNTERPATAALPLTERDVEQVEDLLKRLKGAAAEAEREGNAVLLGLYVRLLKIVSPEVQRFRARLEREERAEIARKHRNLRAIQRFEQSNAGGSREG